MENIILEMKKIVEECKGEASFIKVRNKLKEYLHYFVLDFIYNSEFKNMIFYGGSCLRIVYNLPRMSIDLDFEADEVTDFNKLKKSLEKYFSANLKLKDKFYIKGEKKGKNVNRIFLNFSLMNEIGLSAYKGEALKIRIDIMSVPKEYLKKLAPVLTLKSKYGKSFVIRHYDLPTLFASKLAAILDRSQKGFTVGREKEKIDFKGRDFYDLIWYMEEKTLPNEEMLKLKGIKGSAGDVFDEIALFISKRKLKEGLKKDLEPLFPGPIDSFAGNFRGIFQKSRTKYINRKIKKLSEIWFDEDFETHIHYFRFIYLCEDGTLVSFLFKLDNDFCLAFGRFLSFNSNGLSLKATVKLSKENEAKINWEAHKTENITKEGRKFIQIFMALFLSKIVTYLKKHNNEVYFTWWESKLIRMADDKFNPEKEIVFSSGQELASNKKITLETLSL